MKYNGFYFFLFKRSMGKVLKEKYGKAFASETMKKSKKDLSAAGGAGG